MTHLITLEMLAHFAILDLGWFASLVLANLFWVFVFLAASFFFFNGKKTIAGFFIVLIYIWAFVDVSSMTGWVFSGLLMMIYLAASIFLGDGKKASNGLQRIPRFCPHYCSFQSGWVITFFSGD